MPAVTVIVPFYNAERTLARCLQSLFEQSFEDIEYVLVNDGSTDGSLAVLEDVLASYPERRDAMRLLIQNPNGGVLAARRRGVSEATGEYIIFADADDVVEKNCYGRLYEEAVRTGADMVRCGYVESDGDHDMAGHFKLTPARDKDQRIREAIALKSDPYLMTKLVRRSIFESPDFVWPVDNIAEDWVMAVQFAFLADKVSWVDECFYHYYVSGPSISHVDPSDRRYMERVLSEKRNVEAVEELLSQRGLIDDYRSEFDSRKVGIKRLLLHVLGDADMRRTWRRTFSEINWRIYCNKYVPLEYKIKHLSAMLGVYTPLYSLFKSMTGR